jgi:hypothetical protein
MEKNSWPTYLKIFAPSWLESINYPFAGVGDLTDLKFYTGVGNNGQWLGFLNPGWFYHDNKEQYNFVTKGETLVAAVSGSTLSQLTSGYSVNFAGSGMVSNPISYRPSWGPVLVTSANTASSFVSSYTFTLNSASSGWKSTGILIYPKQNVTVSVQGIAKFASDTVSSSGTTLVAPNLPGRAVIFYGGPTTAASALSHGYDGPYLYDYTDVGYSQQNSNEFDYSTQALTGIYDFQQNVTLNSVYAKWDTIGFYAGGQASYSLDGINWTNISVTSGSSAIVNQTCRYARLVVSATGTNGVQVIDTTSAVINEFRPTVTLTSTASTQYYAYPEGAYWNYTDPNHLNEPTLVMNWGSGNNFLNLSSSGFSPMATNVPPWCVAMALIGSTASSPGPSFGYALSPGRQTTFQYGDYYPNAQGRCPWELYFAFNDGLNYFTDNASSFTITVTTDPPTITQPNNAHQYTQHHNCFSPGNSLSWTSLNGSIYYASLPASSLLVGMRDLTTLPMGSVSSTGFIVNNKLYFYDYIGNKVYARPDDVNNINFYADIVYQKPSLRFRELVVLEDSGLLPSYRNIENIDIIRGNQIYNYCYSVSGYLTNPVTGITNGDWVVLEYNISKSFILTDHQTLQYYIGYSKNPLGDNFIINYETSIPDSLPSISLASPTNLFNLNPIFKDAYRAGYLHHALPVSGYSSYWTYKKLLLSSDKLETCSDWNESFTVSLTLLDKNNLPLPQYPVTLTYTPITTSLFIYPIPTSTTSTSALITSHLTTDNRGEVNAVLKNIGYGLATISAFAGTLSGNVLLNSLPASSFINLNKFLGGQVNLVLTKDSTSRSSILGAVSTNDLDGIPSVGNVTLYSKYSSEFNDLGSPPIVSTGSLNLTTQINTFNIGGIKKFGYTPQPNDKLLGLSSTGQSDIL